MVLKHKLVIVGDGGVGTFNLDSEFHSTHESRFYVAPSPQNETILILVDSERLFHCDLSLVRRQAGANSSATSGFNQLFFVRPLLTSPLALRYSFFQENLALRFNSVRTTSFLTMTPRTPKTPITELPTHPHTNLALSPVIRTISDLNPFVDLIFYLE